MYFPSSALVLVDIQHDFLPPSGSLAVPDGLSILPLISTLSTSHTFSTTILTQDWHPSNHISFTTAHVGPPQAKPFSTATLRDIYDRDGNAIEQTVWPVHCVQGSPGAEFAQPILDDVLNSERRREEQNEDDKEEVVVIRKGMNWKYDSYSAFWDNGKIEKTELDDVLTKKAVKRLYVCGLALDVCVLYTVLDARELGYDVVVIEDACLNYRCSEKRGLSASTNRDAIKKMREAGAVITTSDKL